MTYNYSDISLQEFPGEVSLILYTGRCDLRCPWCFNSDLQTKKPLSYKQMKDAIDEHRDFITSVVFSGGEPLLNPYLNKTIRYAKSKDLKIKLNTNGLVSKSVHKNWFIGYIDYINVSIKGTFDEYNSLFYKKPLTNLSLHTNILEYSFVYSPTIWPIYNLKKFRDFLINIVCQDWTTAFSDTKWSQPDLFTVSQMQVGNCLNLEYNNCSVPNQEECISVAKMFRNIPRKKLIVETKEFGRKVIK